MSVINVPATRRQCPRCRRFQPASAAVCEGCGRRFQVPAPEPHRAEASGVYAGVPSSLHTHEGSSGTERGVSAWWGPAFAALLVTPLGWVLLPLALLLCLVTAALSLAALPTLLGALAVGHLRTARLPLVWRVFFGALALTAGLSLNVILWHVVQQAAFAHGATP